MRRAELVDVHEDIDERTSEVRIRNKERLIKIPAGIWERLVDYMERYRGYEPGALLTPIWNNRNKPRITKKGLSEATINLRLKAIRKKANHASGIAIAPHDM